MFDLAAPESKTEYFPKLFSFKHWQNAAWFAGKLIGLYPFVYTFNTKAKWFSSSKATITTTLPCKKCLTLQAEKVAKSSEWSTSSHESKFLSPSPPVVYTLNCLNSVSQTLQLFSPTCSPVLITKPLSSSSLQHNVWHRVNPCAKHKIRKQY